MPAIIIPTLILIALVLFSTQGDIVKNFDFSSLSELYPTTLIKGRIPPPQLPSQTPQTQLQQVSLATPPPASAQFPQPKISPYLGKIEISRLTLPTISLSSSFTLIPKLTEGEKIDITGWYFETTIGRYIIPQGVQILKGNEKTGIRKNIVLESGQKFIFSTGRNPDIDFLENDWYVYIESEEFLLETHDRVTLYDQNNRFVGQKIY